MTPSLSDPSFRRRVAYNTAFQFVGKVIGLLLGLVVFGILTRYLGREQFGAYATIIGYLGFFATIADFGLYTVMIRELARTPAAEQSRLFSNAATLRIALTLATFAVGILVALLFPYAPTIRLGIAVGALAFLFVHQNSLYAGLFQYHFATTTLAVSEIVGRVVLLAGVLAVVSVGGGVLAVMAAVIAGSAATFLVNALVGRRYLRLRWAADWAIWRRLLAVAVPLAAAAVLNIVYFRFDTVILSLFHSSTDVGIYNAAYKVIEILVAFPAIFTGLLLGTFTTTIVQDQERFARVFRKGFEILLLGALPLAIGGILVAPGIISVVAGAAYPESVGVLRIVLVAIPFMFVSNLATQAFVAGDKMKTLALLFGIGAFLSVGSNLLAIPPLSYIGAAATTVGVEAVVAVLAYILVARFFRVRPPARILLPALFANVILAGSLWLLRGQNVFLAVAIGGLLYVGAVILFRGVRPADLRDVFRFRPPYGIPPSE